MQIVIFGNESQKEEYIPYICNGERIAAQAITEADAGSDVNAMRTKAKKNDNGYTINGTKLFISNGPIADFVVVFAVTGNISSSLFRISCFIVDKDVEGFDRSKPIEKMGLNTLQNCELIFIDCKIPHAKLIGREGQGIVIFNEIIELERILLFAAHVGTIERLLKKCVDYTKIRRQFGKTIGSYQSISSKIARMKVKLELGKLILYKAAWLKSKIRRANIESSILKLFISESLKETCIYAIQIHGAYGYMKEYEIERDLRDSIASTIYSGTSEIQINIISRLLCL